MYFISQVIPNETSEYRIQLQRSAFILSKLIDRVPDDDDEESSEKAALLHTQQEEGGRGEEEQEEEAIGFGDEGVELASHILLQSNPMLQHQPQQHSSSVPLRANEV
jgi:hypothetical protein